MFTVLALLTPGAPDVQIETFADRVLSQFGGAPGFKLEYEVLPFNTERNLFLQWQSDWVVRVIYETAEDDELVVPDSIQIAKILGKAAPAGIADCTRRVRVVFEDDPDEQHIDDMLEIMSMLEELDGAVVFDPQKNKIMD